MATRQQWGEALQGAGAWFAGRGPQYEASKAEQARADEVMEFRRQLFDQQQKEARLKQSAEWASRWGRLAKLSMDNPADQMLRQAVEGELVTRIQGLEAAGEPAQHSRHLAKLWMQDPRLAYAYVTEDAGDPKFSNFMQTKGGGVVAYNNARQQMEGVPLPPGVTLAPRGQDINIDLAGRQKESQILAEGRAKDYQTYKEEARAASSQNALLTRLQNIDVDTGFGTESRLGLARAVNGLFGEGTAANFSITDVKVPGLQVFKAISEELLRGKLNMASGTQTEGDAVRMRATLASLDKEADANKFIIGYMKEGNQRLIERERFYRKWLSDNNGTLAGADDAWDEYINTVPMIGAVTDKKTGLPLLFSDFMRRAKQEHPNKSRKELLEAWKQLNNVQ